MKKLKIKSLFYSFRFPEVVIPYNRIILLLAIVALLFSVTNFVVFSAILILVTIVVPFSFTRYILNFERISSAYIFSTIMLAFFILDILFYDKKAFFSFDFFRRDGNVFISFAPLIVLGVLTLDIDATKLVRKFIICASIINIIFLLLWKFHIALIKNDYHFLFVAHNAAGGFIASLLALSAGYVLIRKNYWEILLFCGNFAALIYTHSRGSILGFFTAIVLFGFMGRFLRRFSLVIIVIINIIVPWWGYSVAGEEGYDAGFISTDVIDLDDGRTANIAERLFSAWPKAIGVFLQSPLLGLGFGSFNDRPYIIEKAAPLFAVNLNQIRNYNDAHAHHTFLHVMAENGLIGLALLLLCLWGIDKTIRNLPFSELSLGLRICNWTAIFASCTEHRYFTPSQMLPFFICLGLAIAARNALKKETFNG